ncbi:MAG TPA: P-type conjugative transfer protein TrbG [Myxococcota bacterium]|nr:P-type conjugative transfer protein TrbG [Myxococcota bacterium]
MLFRSHGLSSLRRAIPAAPLAAALACASPAPLAVEDLAAATRLSDEPRTEAADPAPPPSSGFEFLGPQDPEIQSAIRRFRETGAAPVVRNAQAGFVIFPYGQMQPILTCKPLRVCEIELEAGEEVLDVALGDPLRWHAQPMESGPPEARAPHVVVKPTEPEISTNLVISTTRRVYHLGLISTTEDSGAYVRSARFYYPQETVAHWTAAKERESKLRAEETQRVVASGPTVRPEDLDFGYSIEGDDTPWRPTQVFDDGIHVYLQMPPSMRVTEAPALFVETASGDRSLVNYRFRGRYYIVDKLFASAVLVLGVGSHQQQVTIRRLHPIAATSALEKTP